MPARCDGLHRCQRLVCRAEATEDVQGVLQGRAFQYAESRGHLGTAAPAIVFVASLDEVKLSAQRKSGDQHFFICDLPDEHEEVQLEAHKPEQCSQYAAVDSSFEVGRAETGQRRLYFAKAGLAGRRWSPRLLLFVQIQTD